MYQHRTLVSRAWHLTDRWAASVEAVVMDGRDVDRTHKGVTFRPETGVLHSKARPATSHTRTRRASTDIRPPGRPCGLTCVVHTCDRAL
jgi:hypothetical protein